MSPRKLAIEFPSVASVMPEPKNARPHIDKRMKHIARSIEAFGLNVPFWAMRIRWLRPGCVSACKP